MPYDTFKDFTAITEVAYSPLAIVVARRNDARDLQGAAGGREAKPDSLSYGTSGNGTSAHLAGELRNYMAGVKIWPFHTRAERLHSRRCWPEIYP